MPHPLSYITWHMSLNQCCQVHSGIRHNIKSFQKSWSTKLATQGTIPEKKTVTKERVEYNLTPNSVLDQGPLCHCG